MKRIAFAALAVVAAACSGFQEPEPLERTVPGLGDPPRTQAPAYVEDAGEFNFPDAGCCPVRFALPAQGETAVALFGFAAPLRPELPMTLDGGAWETVVCMPLATQPYGYHLYVTPDVGESDAGLLFEDYAVNPNAPVVMSAEYGLLNEFQAEDAGSCGDLDTALHGNTTVPDAGSADPDGGATDGG